MSIHASISSKTHPDVANAFNKVKGCALFKDDFTVRDSCNPSPPTSPTCGLSSLVISKWSHLPDSRLLSRGREASRWCWPCRVNSTESKAAGGSPQHYGRRRWPAGEVVWNASRRRSAKSNCLFLIDSRKSIRLFSVQFSRAQVAATSGWRSSSGG